MSRIRWIREVFIEALVVALAEMIGEALGWLFRRAWKRVRRKKKDEDA